MSEVGELEQPEAEDAPARKQMRKRKRNMVSAAQRTEIAERVVKFYNDEKTVRNKSRGARLQRYAKLRMWRQGTDWPWPNACFSMDTELLTDTGWRPVGEIGVGDRVYSRAATGEAEYRTVAATNRTVSQRAVAFQGKSVDLLVTPNHRMVINDWAGRQQFVKAEDIVGAPNRAWTIPLTSEWHGERPETISGLPAREYCRLLGWFISEGSQNGTGTIGIAQSKTANPEKCKIIERDLEAAKITWRFSGSTYSLHSRTMPTVLKQELRAMGLCHEKVLPDAVLSLAPDLLEELLDAMILGDGHTNRRKGHRSYFTTSLALADQVQIIAQKIGQRATISSGFRIGGTIDGRKIPTPRPIYTVSINLKKAVQVRKLRAEFVVLDAPTEFACVTVPPHSTLYARRNGKAVWCGNSDAVIPDMLQDSLRVQDTLHNAVMSQKPAVVSNASKQIDKDKEKTVDNLLQFQFFVEQPGEKIIGEMAEAFTNDPACTVFVPWIREKRKISDVQVFDGIPEDADPRGFFLNLLKQKFPDANRFDEKNGWDWTVTVGDDEFEVCFYTNEADEIEMVVEREAIVYDGPRVLVKDYDQVLYPARSANLQCPGPANPGGAPYVILEDSPLVAEIASLKESGYYDLLTKEGLEKFKTASSSETVSNTNTNDSQRQKDQLQGVAPLPGQPLDQNHKKLTRLMCFDTFDIDGDGMAEDVVFWVILETKTLLRVRRLGDVSPGSPPRRPLFGGCFLPVQGRYDGMCLPEIMEGTHDAIKVMVDQGINANDLAIASPGYYRPSGGMNPEVLTIEPFTLTPLQNPQQDVVFPQIGNAQAMGFSLNMINMLGMWQDKVTMVNDNSFGQVAPGSSSALRTIGGMAMLQGQGEARPERILRRFFSILSDVYSHMHRLNKSYLPEGKEFRIIGVLPSNANPYVKLDTREKYAGEFDFSFSANAFNSSKAALQQALMATMQVLVNPLALQMGTVTPENVYNMQFDYVMAQGQPANRYTTPPTPEAGQPRILAEEAITEIMRNQLPIGAPLEPGGVQEHMQKLTDYAASPEFGLLEPHQVDLFRQYLLKLQEMVAQAAQAQQLQAAAGQFSQAVNQGKPGAPATNPQAPASAPAPVSGPNELQDERLPGAGGGANGA